MEFHVSDKPQRLEITVNTSRILTLDKSIPRIFVTNTDTVQATPLTENQVQISGLAAGVTHTANAN